MACSPLFHSPGHGIDIKGPKLQKSFTGKGEGLRRHIINVAYKLRDLSVSALILFFNIHCLSQENTHAVGLVKFLGADTDPHAFTLHHRHRSKGVRKMSKQRRPGGRTQLSLYLSAIAWNSLQKICRSRRRHRHHTMRTAHRSASHMYRRDNDPLGFQKIHGVADTCHIRHRIQGSHLVEVHISQRAAMRMRFRLGDGIIYCLGMALHLIRQI